MQIFRLLYENSKTVYDLDQGVGMAWPGVNFRPITSIMNIIERGGDGLAWCKL